MVDKVGEDEVGEDEVGDGDEVELALWRYGVLMFWHPLAGRSFAWGRGILGGLVFVVLW